MKKLLLVVLLIASAICLNAQTAGLSYQAVILNPDAQEIPGVDAQENLLVNATVGIQFTITNVSGNEEYQESHTVSTDMYGMVNLLIGAGNNSYNSFSDIVWDGASKKLKVDIDFSGGTNYSLLSENNLVYMPQPATTETLQFIADNTTSIAEEAARAVAAEETISINVATNASAITEIDVSGISINTTSIESETNRAIAAESLNETAIATETTRATGVEGILTGDIASNATSIVSETNRAIAAESLNETAIATETTRATGVEVILTGDIASNATSIESETNRAIAAEDLNETAIETETTRALGVEATLTGNIASNATSIESETNRATATETTLQINIDAEITLARAEALANTSAILTEINRATEIETELQANIDAEAAAARAAELLNAAEITSNATAIEVVQLNVDQNETDSDLADVQMRTELDATQVGAGLQLDGSYLANASTSFINESTSLVGATEDLDAVIAALLITNNAMQVQISELETAISYLTNTGTYTPNVIVGDGNFLTANYFQIGNTVFVIGNFTDVDMTFKSPSCPVAETLPVEVEEKIAGIEQVKSAKVTIVFDPTWTKDMMSEEAQLDLGFM